MRLIDNILYKFDIEYGDVIGVDEAGRGPLAGPVVASAVFLKDSSKITEESLKLILEIDDSKKISEPKREKLFNIIKENFFIGIGIVDNHEIDRINILNATFLAMRRALKQLQELSIEIDKKLVLVDGNHKIREYSGNQQAVIKGDSKSLSIAAASIIAKVTRDKIMEEMDKRYPNYEFSKHKGYGTKKHRELILELGPCEIHRVSFLKKILISEEVASEKEIKKNIKNRKLF